MAQSAEAIHLILHSKMLFCDADQFEGGRGGGSTAYSVSTYFVLISFSFSFVPGCSINNNNTSGSSTGILSSAPTPFLFFFWKMFSSRSLQKLEINWQHPQRLSS